MTQVNENKMPFYALFPSQSIF